MNPAFLNCVDCGSPARHYDHRDYLKPLEVEPVCHGCNLRRGPARFVCPPTTALPVPPEPVDKHAPARAVLAAFVGQYKQVRAAQILGVSQGNVSFWLRGVIGISRERAIDIEQRTGGAIKRHELRPDLFGESSSQVAA